MATRGVNVEFMSNVACEPGSRSPGSYTAITYMRGPSGNILAPDPVSLGKKVPEDLNPASILEWVYVRRELRRKHEQRRSIAIDPRQIVAVGIWRICGMPRHADGAVTPHLDARGEHFMSLVLAKPGGERIKVMPPNVKDIDAHDQATLTRSDGWGEVSRVTILPQVYGRPDTEVVGDAIELPVPGRTKYYAGLTDRIQVYDHATIWAAVPTPPMPPSPTMPWQPGERPDRVNGTHVPKPPQGGALGDTPPS